MPAIVDDVSTARPGRQIRLYVDLPYPDETWSSFFDRLAQPYQVSRLELISLLAPEWRPWRRWSDFDSSMPKPVHSALLAALAVSDVELPNESRGVGSEALPLARRVDYCPLCFIDDLAHRRTPYFRYQWTVPVYTCCFRHGTPLVTWRRVRGGDERVLPLRWHLHPKPKFSADCGWLDEDAKLASSFRPDRLSDQSPLGLVKRLSKSLVRFRSSPPGFKFVGMNSLNLAFDELVRLGASTTYEDPLALQLRPMGNAAIFGGPRHSYKREFYRLSNCWRAAYTSVEYRRSLLWFAARTLLGSSEPTPLADGRIAPPCNGERWLDEFIKPGIGHLQERLPLVEPVIRLVRTYL